MSGSTADIVAPKTIGSLTGVIDGPNLANAGSKAWIQRLIRDSSAEDLFGKGAEMPKFGKKLSDDEIRQLSELIVAQRSGKGSG